MTQQRFNCEWVKFESTRVMLLCLDLPSSSPAVCSGVCYLTPTPQSCPMQIGAANLKKKKKKSSIYNKFKTITRHNICYQWVNYEKNHTSLCNLRFSAFNSSSTFSAFSAADLYRVTCPSSLVTCHKDMDEN